MPKTFSFGSKRRYKKLRGRHAKKSPTEDGEIVANESFVLTSDDIAETSASVTPEEAGDNAGVQKSDDAQGEGNLSRSEMKFSALSTDEDYQSSADPQRYFIVHSSLFASLMQFITCPDCIGSELELETSCKLGLACKFSLHYLTCKKTVWSSFTSPRSTNRFDINVGAVLAAKECGVKLSTVRTMFAMMNMPTPMHHKTFNDISSEIRAAAVEAAEDCMNKCASVIKERHAVGIYSSTQQTSSDLPVIGVSFDGTRQKRGHSSHNGVGVAIDIDSGFVIDTQAISNYCKGCVRAPPVTSDNYTAWQAAHNKCDKNFDGSANAMEMEAAGMIFSRSIERRGLVYGTMLCDGDSKALKHVNDQRPYDIEVIKEDCVNHIAKRMFNPLTAVKQANKEALNRKLTQPIIEKISNTYASNLKKNAPDPTKMKNGVLAGFFHMLSTDKEPNHRYCPTGSDSWCRYNRAIALGEQPPPHRPSLSSDVAKYVYPIIKRLSDTELLERCAKMTTQNANESFNTQIWKRCPKTEFATHSSVETAVALATLSFNLGPLGLRKVMENLGLQWQFINQEHALKKLKLRITNARSKVKGISKWKRKNVKRRRIQEEHDVQLKEGETYASGAFNC